MAKVNGNRGLNFSGSFDIQQILDNQKKVIQGFNDMKAAAERSINGNGSSNLRQANLATAQALREARLELERLKREEQELLNQNVRTAASTADLNRRYAENRLRQQELREATRLARTSQQAANGSYREAQQRLRELGQRIREVDGGFEATGRIQRARIEEYRRLNAQLTEFDRRLGINSRNVGNYRSALGGLAGALKGIAAGYLSFYGIINLVSGVVKKNAEISDSLADVQRTAQLTGREAENLLETFKGFDTRTNLKGLLAIAGIGGQIGIAKEDLEGFTRSIDQLSIVLANEIPGGADAVATALGKINGVFDVQKKENTTVEESFNKTGAAILGLGQSGLATGDFLVDFTQRVAGTAKQAGIALPTILAYGSVLEEAGKSAEVAGSSLNKIIAGLSVNRKKYFAIAQLADSNLTLKEFTRVINTDVNAALQLFFKGLNSGNPSQTAFADRLATIPRLAGETRSSIIALAQGQEKLSEKIKISNRDYEDQDKVANQALIKNNNLAGSIDKLNKAWENATTSGAMAKFFKAIVDGVTFSIKALDDLFDKIARIQREAALKNFNRTGKTGSIFFSADDARQLQQEAKDAANRSYAEGLKDQGEAYARYLADRTKTEIELSRTITAQSAKLNNLEEQRNKLLKNRADFNGILSNQEKQLLNQTTASYGRQKATVEALIKTRNKLYPGKITQTDEAGVTTPVKGADGALSRQRTLQSEIDKINNDSRAKQLTADDKELKDIDDKFAAISQKVKNFNANPKNTIKVDGSGLKASRQREIDEAVAKQTIERDKITIEAQKQLYSDYESYKLQVGETAAKERFSQDLGAYSSYVDYIKSLLPKDSDVSVLANKQRDLINKDLLPKAIAEQKKLDQARYTTALLAAQTYGDKIQLINETYERNRAALGTKATADQLNNLKRQRDEAIRSANEENAVAKSGYSNLMMQYDELTRGAIIKRLEAIKRGYQDEYKLGKINAEQLKSLVENINSEIGKLTGNNSFNKISQSIKEYRRQVELMGKDSEAATEAEDNMYAAISEGAADASSMVSELASSFAELGIGGEDLQDTLKNVSGALDGISGIAKGLATGNPVDVVTGSIKLLTSAIQLFNTKDKKLQKQINQYKEQLTSLGTAFKQLERDAANAVGNDVYQDQAAQIENLRAQSILLSQARQAEMDKKKSDQSVIDDYTNQINDIPNQIDDINKAISQNLIQTNFRDFSNSLADAFADAFKSGEDSAKAFDDVFNNVIANAIKNSLKLSILDPIVAKFTTDLTKFARENGNSVIGFDFDSYKEQLKQAGELFNSGLKGSEEFFKDAGVANVTNTLKGSIQASLTEDTGTILAGVFRGVQLTLINIEGILRASSVSNAAMSSVAMNTLNGIIAIQNNTLRTANNTDQLARLEAVESSLSSIAKNTGDTIGLQLRAAGKFNF